MTGLPPKPPESSRIGRRLHALGRPFLFALGWVFTLVGIAGIFLPLVPGVVFLILAAACFARSSPRFEAWLLGHKRLGPPIRRWRETGAIPRYGKILSSVAMAASWLILFATSAPAAAKAGSLAAMLAAAAYVLTRPDE